MGRFSVRRYWARCLVILVAGCGSSPSDDGGPDTPQAPTVVRQAVIDFFIDAANRGDASDFRAGIQRPTNQTGIQEYRVVIIPADAVGGFGAEQAAAAPASSFQVIATGAGTAEVSWPANATDSSGNSVMPGVGYVIKVYSVTSPGNFTATISPASPPVTLAETLLVETITEPIAAGSGGMDVDADGNIYFADFGASLGGTPASPAPPPPFLGCCGLRAFEMPILRTRVSSPPAPSNTQPN
jgi:hypothetical protein